MSYTFIKDKDDHLKMVVANSLQGLLNLFGDFNFTQTGSGQSLTDSSMIIENFSVPATYWGFSVQENASLGLVGAAAAGLGQCACGTFGMKFLLANPVLAALAMLPPIAGLSGAMISYIHKMGALGDAGNDNATQLKIAV